MLADQDVGLAWHPAVSEIWFESLDYPIPGDWDDLKQVTLVRVEETDEEAW